MLTESEGCVGEGISLTSEKSETMVLQYRAMSGLGCTFGNC